MSMKNEMVDIFPKQPFTKKDRHIKEHILTDDTGFGSYSILAKMYSTNIIGLISIHFIFSFYKLKKCFCV